MPLKYFDYCEKKNDSSVISGDFDLLPDFGTFRALIFLNRLAHVWFGLRGTLNLTVAEK
jgi:hypothetical protein